jgi:hypothetical protein
MTVTNKNQQKSNRQKWTKMDGFDHVSSPQWMVVVVGGGARPFFASQKSPSYHYFILQ